jgi:hypothetical protein
MAKQDHNIFVRQDNASTFNWSAYSTNPNYEDNEDD